MRKGLRIASLLVLWLGIGPGAAAQDDAAPVFRKLEDRIIYRDARFYSAFPSVVRRPDGELIVAFRRAPDWRAFGAAHHSHTDAKSQLVLVRSSDDGQSWSETPELIHAHPFGGLQDPCLLQLRDQTLLCATYGWAKLQPEWIEKLKPPVTALAGDFVFLGGSIVSSGDGGRTWSDPMVPPAVPSEKRFEIFGNPLPAYNRGAMCEGRDGRIHWVVAAADPETNTTGTHLLVSNDKGSTWEYSCPVAVDEKVTFNEASVYETPNGDLVVFLRTGDYNDHTVVARSRNGGKSFEKWQNAGFKGHPHHALRLEDNRVLLVYGYRHAPFGIRARVLDAEGSDFASAPEHVLREDGGNGDLGYPWAVLLPDQRALVVYYFNQDDGVRHIAGTIVSFK